MLTVQDAFHLLVRGQASPDHVQMRKCRQVANHQVAVRAVVDQKIPFFPFEVNPVADLSLLYPTCTRPTTVYCHSEVDGAAILINAPNGVAPHEVLHRQTLFGQSNAYTQEIAGKKFGVFDLFAF